MANCGDGRIMFEVGVGEDRPLAQQLLDSGGVIRSKARQIVVTELIDGDEEHQPHVRAGRRLRSGPHDTDRGEREEKGAELIHVFETSISTEIDGGPGTFHDDSIRRRRLDRFAGPADGGVLSVVRSRARRSSRGFLKGDDPTC